MDDTRIPGRYTLLEEVGRGGMAVVYRARDESLKREVAVKVLHAHLSTEPESKARLEREAQAVAKLRHENILEIFDYSGPDSAAAYLVTELIAGRTLKALLSERPIRHPEVAALIVSEMCRALEHAHGLGIIHRDVKPENVMIRRDGVVKLTDFGIAQVIDLQRMTVTGQLLGSPAFMAPELVEGRPLDFRTDVFSAGVVLYQATTGELPFSGKNPHEVLRRIIEARPRDPRALNPRIGDSLARILGRALARTPEARYPDAAALGRDLAAYAAQGGLVDAKPELAAYLADPAAYEAALPARLAPALVASAEAQLEARRRGPALELWNRVLAFDPENARVRGALRRMEGRARMRKAALASAGALIAGGAAVAAVSYVRARPQPSLATSSALATPARARTSPASAFAVAAARPVPPPPVAQSAPRVPPAARLAGAAPSAHRSPPREARPQPPRPSAGAAPPAAPVAARTFTLGPTPQNVDVYLDGQKQFAYDTDHTALTVPWNGPHVIEFRSPSGCCFVERVEVGPDRPAPPDNVIARRLKWRPARLVVETSPPIPGAKVMVHDPSRGGRSLVGKAGDELLVTFRPDDEASKEIEIAVDTGDGFTSERVHVRAGEQSTHTVKVHEARK